MKRIFLVAVVLAACGSGGQQGVSHEARPATVSANRSGQVARVMTRNLFLGADLSGAMVTDPGQFVVAAGAILRQVDATNFPVRAHGLAAEILAVQPDLVGLQEAALWRVGPVDGAPTTTRYDYLQLLLDQLNAGEERYRVAAVQEEFDFIAIADYDGDFIPDTSARLTMRDAILERIDAGIHVSNPQMGHYQALLPVPSPAGALPVTRGWLSVDARVRGSLPFRFIATHFEAFDPRTMHPSFRAMQASELAAVAAASELPVVLVGDLNSDDDTVVPDDQQAYRVLLANDFVERSTNDPLSCCINSDTLQTGDASMFDHQVDHIMTNAPDLVALVSSTVTGRTMPASGWWDSDHAGVFSALRIH